MPVSGDTGLPIAPRNKTWNGSDARRRVVDFYTKGEKTNWSQVKRAFMWIDPGKEDMLTGYNLGFADIVDGKLQIIDNGVFAVAGGHGVSRIRAPSSAEKNTIKRKVNTIYRRMKAKWPNDRFNFDPPFPDVKEHEAEEEHAMENDYEHDTEDDATKTIMAEVSEKFFPQVGGATSFADLSAMEAVRQAIQKVFKTVHGFEMLAYNIARESESPSKLVLGLQRLTKEMVTIFEDMTFDEEKATENDKGLTSFVNQMESQDWGIKQWGNSALLKNENGDQFFYGRFTNNLLDKDGEILISDAHKEFAEYLDANPDMMPALWDWHEEETEKSSKAVWHDYADGFFHMIWPVTGDEAKGIELFAEEFEPGMSHGFEVLDRDGNDKSLIAKYRTFEASILPLENAANEWTTFELLKERKEKMFSPEKERALELLSLGRYKKPLGKASEADAQALDELGAQRKDKEKGSVNMEKDVENVEEEVKEQEQTETPKKEEPSSPDLEGLQISIVEGLNIISARMDQIEETLKEHSDALKGIKKSKGQSPSVAAWVAAQKAQSSVPKDEDDDDEESKRRRNPEVPKDDPFLAGPEEEPFSIDGHLLAKL